VPVLLGCITQIQEEHTPILSTDQVHTMIRSAPMVPAKAVAAKAVA
jgi:hypothetical protein